MSKVSDKKFGLQSLLVKIVVVSLCIAFMILAFTDVEGFLTNARNGLYLFGTSILPVLFPFFFISGLLIELDLFKRKSMQRIGVVVMSFLSGYPTGARMLSQLYQRGEISRSDAIKMATYTSTCSPIFIIATLGAALYQNVQLGVIIFMAHIFGALATGAVFAMRSVVSDTRSQNFKETPNTGICDITGAVSNALYSAIQNILAVGGLIIVFFIASAGLPWGVAGIIEMTTGVFRAERIVGGIWRIIIPCAIVSFGGLCVSMQGFVFLKAFKMPVWFYFAYKITHTIFAVIICALIYLFLV